MLHPRAGAGREGAGGRLEPLRREAGRPTFSFLSAPFQLEVPHP